MRSVSFTVILAAFAALVSCRDTTPTSTARDLVLSFDVIQPIISAGTTPRFHLKITNISGRPVRVLDAEKRRDLQDTYYEVVITKESAPVHVPVAGGVPSDARQNTMSACTGSVS